MLPESSRLGGIRYQDLVHYLSDGGPYHIMPRVLGERLFDRNNGDGLPKNRLIFTITPESVSPGVTDYDRRF